MLVISLVFIVLLLILSGTKRKADRSDNFMELFMFLERAEERAREREAQLRERELELAATIREREDRREERMVAIFSTAMQQMQRPFVTHPPTFSNSHPYSQPFAANEHPI